MATKKAAPKATKLALQVQPGSSPNDPHVMMLSGGLDSVCLAHYAKSTGINVKSALYFDYGHESASRELHAARRTAHMLDIPFEPVNISGLKYLFFGILPTDFHPMMAECKCNDLLAPHALAATYAVLRGFKKILIGTIKNDVEEVKGLPDYLHHMTEAINAIHSVKFEIVTPFINLSKPEVVQLGQALGADLSESWCCYSGDIFHCGECRGCEKRQDAFKKAEVKDAARFKNFGVKPLG